VSNSGIFSYTKQQVNGGRIVMPVIVENINIGGVPTLLVYKENERKLPVVFFVHGLMSKKEKDLNIGYELACRGIACVLIDARQHGERLSSELANAKDELVANLFFDIVLDTAEDVSQVITHYSMDDRVNTERSGMAGISMGGFITYYVLTKDRRVKAAAPIIATPDWKSFIMSYKDKFNSVDETSIIQKVSNIDPIINYRKVYPCALLMQNGKVDSLIPYSGAEKFYNLLLPLYRENQDQLKLYFYEDTGHDVTEPMRQRLYDFFVKYLLNI